MHIGRTAKRGNGAPDHLASISAGSIHLHIITIHGLCRWRKQALEEQQRFKQAEGAYRTQIQQLQAELLQQRTAPQPAGPTPAHPPSPLQHAPTHAAEEGVAHTMDPPTHPPPAAATGLAVAEDPAGQTSPHHPPSPAGSIHKQPASQNGQIQGAASPQAQAANERALEQSMQPDAAPANPQDAPRAVGAQKDEDRFPSEAGRPGADASEMANGAANEVVMEEGAVDNKVAAEGDAAAAAAEAGGPGCITAQMLAAALARALNWAGEHASLSSLPFPPTCLCSCVS